MVFRMKKLKQIILENKVLFLILFMVLCFWLSWPIVRKDHILQTGPLNIVDNNNEVINSMKIIINDSEYIVDLEDNDTVKELLSRLPLELNMSELNCNEKYVYLDESLPTNSYNPKNINAGDVMLFGDNCLVVFYKSFETSYSYTKIGHINNLGDLGSGNIKVKIEK